jgi:hypothetical protein
MPVLDNKRGVLVVRIVYDGPPFSGKTTSLLTLARGLGVSVTTPEEIDGRTQFFDWMDYVGGLFEGRQIRCQIVSVPGQEGLAARRAELLAMADAVVLVADTRAPALPEALAVLERLLPHCRAQEPPVGIVLQANKRDAADSVPRARLQSELGAIAPLAIVETVATAGDGIREAFVFAVRLALDRVRAFAERGELPEGEPDVTNPQQLLERLKANDVRERARRASFAETLRPPFEVALERAADQPLPPPDPGALFDEEIALLSSPRTETTEGELLDEDTFVPDPMMPGGFIWPPVDGRVVLHEVAERGVTPVRTARGDWWASGRGCLFHSAKAAIFTSADRGRQALIEWARMHAINMRCLSPGRTVVLAAAGFARFRLWQLIRSEQALRERVAGALQQADPVQLAAELSEVASHLVQARALLHTQDLRLPCTLWTISGETREQPRFVGLMPEVGFAGPEEPQGAALLERELLPLLSALFRQREDAPRIADAIAGMRDRRREGAALLGQLALRALHGSALEARAPNPS